MSGRPVVLATGIACLAACAAWQPPPDVTQQRAAASGTCDAAAVQWAVGQAATIEVTGRVWRESGAGLVRPLRPEQVVGGSRRPDRVTIDLDRDNVIRRVYCG